MGDRFELARCARDEAAHNHAPIQNTSRHCTYANLCIGQDTLLNFGTTFAPLRFTLGSVASHPIPLSPNAEVTAANFFNRKP